MPVIYSRINELQEALIGCNYWAATQVVSNLRPRWLSGPLCPELDLAILGPHRYWIQHYPSILGPIYSRGLELDGLAGDPKLWLKIAFTPQSRAFPCTNESGLATLPSLHAFLAAGTTSSVREGHCGAITGHFVFGIAHRWRSTTPGGSYVPSGEEAEG
ncbi:hypothetical protein Nepgr_007184 [Nepenthes gracilis]|uniref:Uncharacterized protein n=1 Tax=Nepenthes gracilis TaxID=150966 RepID=A0AAD3S6M6_NEPGR|nr:hypothetical protein Nepgr_007184 [Nepenthes gracilis]